MAMSTFSHQEPTKMSLTSYGKTTECTFPYSDTTIDEMMDMFFTCMIGATWQPETIYQGMLDYAQEHLEVYNDDLNPQV